MSVNRTRLHRLCVGLACLLLFCAILPMNASAAPLIEPERPVTLTINYRPAAGVEFSLYRVADVSSIVEFTLTAPFDTYPVLLDDLDSAGWKALADTLAGYVARDKIPALDGGTTDAAGLVHFPQQQQELSTGVYLVIGQQSEEGKYTYTPEPFLICLPNRNALDKWDYDVTAVPKYDSVYHPEMISRKVLKVWDDAGNQTKRPTEIEIQLLRDGAVFDTVKLNKANNWRYTWDSLDGDYLWQVVEKTVPKGYTVTTGREGSTFVITNSSTTPGKPGLPGESGTIAQTGMLWWPVPVLAGVGILILLMGLGRRWKQNGSGNG